MATDSRNRLVVHLAGAGGVLAVNYLKSPGDGFADWTNWPGHDEGGSKAWFNYRRGRIVVKNPDEQILAKMKQISVILGAKVVGDEGEEY